MKILVVDDDPKITNMLKRNLILEGHKVCIANDGYEGLDKALQEDFDLIILDIMLPKINGYEICSKIRAYKETPLLMLTAKDDIADRVKGLNLGADDYLVKPFALAELLARINALLRRMQKKKEAILTFSNLTLNPATREVWRGKVEIQLTAKEFDLLYLFMQNPRLVLKKDLIMDRIWGYDYEGESNVLEVFIGYLRQKLEAQGEPRLIHTIRGAGYTLRE